jgi:hypothetical protein
MAIGFPQNTYEQQRKLSMNTKKYSLAKQLQSLEVRLEETVVNTAKGDTNTQESLVEMIANYVIRFFTEKIFDKKTLSLNTATEVRMEYSAIKKDFEYCIIG